MATSLLVQVVEGRTRRPQPVLERRDVACVRVAPIEVAHCCDREPRVLPVLLGRERPGAGVLGVVRGAVDEVPTGDDDLVVAGEEPDRLALEVVLVERLRAGARRAPRPHPDARQGGHVRPPCGRGEVCRPVRQRLGRRLVAVGQVPVVVGEDLEEVGEEPEPPARSRRACSATRPRTSRTSLPDGPSRTTRAISGVVSSIRPQQKAQWRSCSSGSRGFGSGRATPRGRAARPGSVHTFVPVKGLTCLMVPSGSRVRGSITLSA